MTFEQFMMITNVGIVTGVWSTLIYIVSQG
jgi:hypothetical protein